MQPYRKHSEVSMKVKAFSCPMCNYSSDYLHTIKRHMDSHTNTKFCLISEPTLVCLKKPYYHSHLSFHQWVQTPGNIYIGGTGKTPSTIKTIPKTACGIFEIFSIKISIKLHPRICKMIMQLSATFSPRRSKTIWL